MFFTKLNAKAVKAVAKNSGRAINKTMKAAPISRHIIKSIKGEKYTVGFSSREVMPDDINEDNYCMAGFSKGKTASGVHDPITVSALWIGCDDNGAILIVTADCIGLTRVEVTRVRDMMSDFNKAHNCKNTNICCSHTHAGFDTIGIWGRFPKSGKNEKYIDKLLNSICSVCMEAYENREPSDIYVGFTAVPMAQSRNRDRGMVNERLTRIRICPRSGNKETWFLNFAAHPNALGDNNRNISADYPYYMREKIYSRKDVNVMFGVGAIGDVEPFGHSENREENARLQGELIGEKAFDIKNEIKLKCEIKVLRQPFYCPVNNSVFAFLAHFDIMSSKRYPCEKSSLGIAHKTELTYIHLGQQKILLMPCESFPETVYESCKNKNYQIRTLEEIAGDKNLLVFSVSNDMIGYVVPKEDFNLNENQLVVNNSLGRRRKSYHESNSLGIRTQEIIAEVFEEMVKRMG